ncbi:MAG TPA: VOC family protein [Pseudomonadales bacterium]
MTKARLQTVVIDCQTENIQKAVSFWSQAMNLEAAPESPPDGRYWTLRGGDINVLIQRVEWPSSYHLDIEADDVDAEADRLEALGAVRKRKQDSWWVMRAPTGHDFCIVPRR